MVDKKADKKDPDATIFQAKTPDYVVVIKSEDNKSAMIELQCETDFVAKGDDFIKLAETLAEKLLKGEIKPGEEDIQEVKDAILKMGENIKIADMKVVEGPTLGN